MGDVVKKGNNFKVQYTIPRPRNTSTLRDLRGSSGDVKTVKSESEELVITDVIGMEIKVETKPQHNYIQNLIYVSFFYRLEEHTLYDNIIYKIELTCHSLSLKNQGFPCDIAWHLAGVQEEINTTNECTLEFEGTINVVDNENYFAPLHQDEELTDFSLRGEDGAINVHKTVLAATSPVFQRMFCGDWKEKSDGSVNVPGMSITVLQKFKDYLYLRTLPAEGVEQLLLLASYYMMPGLECRCIDSLMLSLTAENMFNLLELAITHKIPVLLVRVLSAVQDCAVTINDICKHIILRPVASAVTTQPAEEP